MNLVEIKDFGFSYPESSRKVLEHVNLNIKEGTLNAVSYTHLTLPTTSRV